MTTPGETAAVEIHPPPDWEAVTQEILCPLCDYNLRGLVEARCPECGHQSNWADLFDPHRGEHRWLFEHHHGKRIRSFLRTLWESQFPHRFWNSARPTHDPKPRRLMVYWLALVMLLALAPFLYVAYSTGSLYYTIYQSREQLRANITNGTFSRFSLNPEILSDLKRLGTEKFLDRFAPYPSLRNALRRSRFYSYRVNDIPLLLLTVAIGYALWTWLTVPALLVFRQTMKQAKSNRFMSCAASSIQRMRELHWR